VVATSRADASEPFRDDDVTTTCLASGSIRSAGVCAALRTDGRAGFLSWPAPLTVAERRRPTGVVALAASDERMRPPSRSVRIGRAVCGEARVRVILDVIRGMCAPFSRLTDEGYPPAAVVIAAGGSPAIIRDPSRLRIADYTIVSWPEARESRCRPWLCSRISDEIAEGLPRTFNWTVTWARSNEHSAPLRRRSMALQA